MDTNVLASAFGTRGLCADLFREVIRRHELAISPAVLAELRDVLMEKFRVSSKDMLEILELLRGTAVLEESEMQHEVQISDRDDCLILSAAMESEAKASVTGDKEVRRLGYWAR